jgi:beta-lactamase regulating signal transducer with metallopeptidase domain
MMDALYDLSLLGRALPSWWMVVTAWTTVVLLVAWLLDRLLRTRIGPGTRALLYAAVLVRAALPSDWNAPLGVLAEPGAERAAIVVATPDVDAPASTIPRPQTVEITAPALAPTVDALGLALFALYLLGVAAVGTTVLARLRRGQLAARTEARTEIADTVAYLHDSLGPMIVGLRRPRIVVPRAFVDTLDRDVLTAVVRHELAHIRHRDGWVAVLLALACALAWPIAPVWIAAARIRLAMELRADAAALDGMPEPTVRGYRRLLLELATRRWQGPRIGVGLGPIDGLRTRLAAMKLAPRTPWSMQLLFTAPLAIALLVCAGPRRTPAPTMIEPALADAPALAFAARSIPFPHCRGIDPAQAMPIPADHDPQALTAMRGRISVMAAALLDAPEGSVDWTEPASAWIGELGEVSLPLGIAEARYVRGLSHLRHGRYEAAAQDMREVVWQAASNQDEHLTAEAAFAMVELSERLGSAAEAGSWGRHAAAAQGRSGSYRHVNQIAAEHALARIAEREGRLADAQSHLAPVLELHCDPQPRDPW